MSLSMYQASVPGFQRTLKALDAILDKAAAYAAERKIDPDVLTSARLAPDMFPLARQVQLMRTTPRAVRRASPASLCRASPTPRRHFRS